MSQSESQGNNPLSALPDWARHGEFYSVSGPRINAFFNNIGTIECADTGIQMFATSVRICKHNYRCDQIFDSMFEYSVDPKF